LPLPLLPEKENQNGVCVCVAEISCPNLKKVELKKSKKKLTS
jgi:hypothetical protein